MSKALWFIIGCVVGDLVGRTLVHVIYIGIIAAILLEKHFCSA
jgi:hypothetical protein